jgi:sterol desaturase/sphingolipid hydroxylase (fatty acid hydroxylase superfamily)
LLQPRTRFGRSKSINLEAKGLNQLLHVLDLVSYKPTHLLRSAAGYNVSVFSQLAHSTFLRIPVETTAWLGTNAVVFLFNFAGVHLRHSHVRLSYGPFLDRILLSPTLHQTHHGCAPQHLGKNLGGMLSIWDWLAGTLYIPRVGCPR